MSLLLIALVFLRSIFAQQSHHRNVFGREPSLIAWLHHEEEHRAKTLQHWEQITVKRGLADVTVDSSAPFSSSDDGATHLPSRCFRLRSRSLAQGVVERRGDAVCGGRAESSGTYQRVGTDGRPSRAVSITPHAAFPFPTPSPGHARVKI